MKIFLVGATGAVGKRLVPMLVVSGHQLIAATRTPHRVDSLCRAGADPVVVDVLDRDAIVKAVVSTRPDVVVHQGTSLAKLRNLKKFDDEFAMTNRLRVEGTENLIAAARAAGARRLIVQSYAGWPNERSGGRVTTESDPLDATPPKAMRRTLAAIRRMEEIVLSAVDLNGIVLRYGSFYGPGTSVAPGGDIVEAIRHRKFPIVGNGAGVWSWIHIDDVACATQAAIERGPAGLYNVVDDDPAEVSTWLPYLAQAVGARPPFHLPAWLARFAIGGAGVSIMTKVRGSSNAKAKRVLGWRPMYASWREGFRRGLDVALPQAACPRAGSLEELVS